MFRNYKVLVAPLNGGKACKGPTGCKPSEDECPATTTKTATTKTRTTTTRSTTTTRTTTTIYDPGNVDCVETQDECTSACEAAADRNYALLVDTRKNGRKCIGPTNCGPGDGLCPTTSTTTATSRTSTTTTEVRGKQVGRGPDDDEVGYYGYGGYNEYSKGNGSSAGTSGTSGAAGVRNCAQNVDPAECTELDIVSCVGASEAAEAVRALCPILCKECLVDDASTEDNNGTSTAGAGKKSTAAAVAVVLVLLLIATVVGIVLFRKRRKEERYRMLLGKRFNGQAAGMVNTSYEQRAVPRNQGGVAMANPAFDSSIMEGADTYEEPNTGQVDVYDGTGEQGGRRRLDTVSAQRNRADSVTVVSGTSGMLYEVPMAGDDEVYEEPDTKQPDVYDGSGGAAYDLPVVRHKLGEDGYDHPVDEYDGVVQTNFGMAPARPPRTAKHNSYRDMPAGGYSAPNGDYDPTQDDGYEPPTGDYGPSQAGGESMVVYSTYDENGGDYEPVNPGTLLPARARKLDNSSYTASLNQGDANYETLEGDPSELYEAMEDDHVGTSGIAATCSRPSPSGGSCKNVAVTGTLFCKGHTCPTQGCPAGKSARESACPAHTSVGTGEDAYEALGSAHYEPIELNNGSVNDEGAYGSSIVPHGGSSTSGGAGIIVNPVDRYQGYNAPPTNPTDGISKKCTRPTPTGGVCKNAAVNGTHFCKRHTCPTSGCTAGKSGQSSTCEPCAHTAASIYGSAAAAAAPPAASPASNGKGKGRGKGKGKAKKTKKTKTKAGGVEEAKCTRPAPSGGSCHNNAVAGTLFCKNHTCSTSGCTAGKSGRESACPAHTTTARATENSSASRGLHRKVSLYGGFGDGEAAAPARPPKRGGFTRNARAGSVYAG